MEAGREAGGEETGSAGGKEAAPGGGARGSGREPREHRWACSSWRTPRTLRCGRLKKLNLWHD